MRHITHRTITTRTALWGPSYDPTQCTTITINEVRNRHHRKIEYLQHFDEELRLNGRRVAYGKKVALWLEQLIGLTPTQLVKACGRVNPYIHDPMGSLSYYE